MTIKKPASKQSVPTFPPAKTRQEALQHARSAYRYLPRGGKNASICVPMVDKSQRCFKVDSKEFRGTLKDSAHHSPSTQVNKKAEGGGTILSHSHSAKKKP